MATYRKVEPLDGYKYEGQTPGIGEAIGLGIGIITYRALANKLPRIPPTPTLYFLPAFMAVGYLFGKQLTGIKTRWAMKNQLILEDYRAAHPEDFVRPPPVYYKDLLMPWIPIR
ncbi:uncharacterized protein LOC127879371 isoform X2 [Dreissena polymorpha]|uniref:uncharacterized protein LOC127879371 isoform X2 n=1 Tax=Dreissena polymorpha TaxID=45954 RepID=UPI002264671A|nr:uncharacterized protein LOC127879371 isoform X2 [Dreissena polymorpha]